MRMRNAGHRIGPSDLREPVMLAVLLLAYSNGLTALAYKRGQDPERSYQFANPLLLLGMLLYGANRPGGLGAVGLKREGWMRSAIKGVGLGVVLAIVPMVFFRKPVVLDTPLEFGPVAKMTGRQLLRDTGLRVPVNIAFMEELAFRGLLYDSLRVRFSGRAAVMGSAAVFAAWHFSVTYASVKETNIVQTARLPSFLQPFIVPVAVMGGMAATGVAGAAFAMLRKRTNNLMGPMTAHWVADSLMIVSLWLSARKQRTRTPV